MNNKKNSRTSGLSKIRKNGAATRETKSTKNNKHIDVVAFSFEETANILFSLPSEKVLANQDKQLSQLRAELEPLLEKN